MFYTFIDHHGSLVPTSQLSIAFFWREKNSENAQENSIRAMITGVHKYLHKSRAMHYASGLTALDYFSFSN